VPAWQRILPARFQGLRMLRSRCLSMSSTLSIACARRAGRSHGDAGPDSAVADPVETPPAVQSSGSPAHQNQDTRGFL
jgi:hypothetical protein